MKKTSLTMFAVVFSLTFSSLAQAVDCAMVHEQSQTPGAEREARKAAPALTAEDLHREFATMAADHRNSIGGRGYMGTKIPNTTQANEIALRYGFFWWGLRVVVVPSKEAMLAHREGMHRYYIDQQKNPDMEPAMVPVYVIREPSSLGYQVSKEKPVIEVDPARLQEALHSGVYEVDVTGKITQINPEFVDKYISPEGFRAFHPTAIPDSIGIDLLIKPSGWASPKQRGVHDFTAWKETPDGKELEKYVVKLLDLGYTFRFNHNPIAAINFLREKQVRSTRALVKDASGNVIVDEQNNPVTARIDTSNETNRFGPKGTAYESVLNRIRNGTVYTSEAYEPQRKKLVAGEPGYFDRSHYIGDSVFYHDVAIARATFYMLAHKLEQLGMRYSDAGMVSNYSRDNGAILMESSDALRVLKAGPPEGIFLSGSYDIRTPEHWKESMRELAKKRNQALGPQKILSRFPVMPLDQNSRQQVMEIAKNENIDQKAIRLMIVPSLDAARDHARALQGASDMPYYLVTQRTPTIWRDGAENLRELVTSTGSDVGLQKALAHFVKDVLAADQMLEVVTFAHPRFVDQQTIEISAKTFAKKLGLETISDGEVQRSRENGFPVFELKAWGLTN